MLTRQKMGRLVLLISISSVLIACSHVAGNIVPDNGPTMENIYDGLGDDTQSNHSGAPVFSGSEESATAALVHFEVLPNPELTLYIPAHLAGAEGLPIPGYWTAFSAYPSNNYALPLAIKSPQTRK